MVCTGACKLLATAPDVLQAGAAAQLSSCWGCVRASHPVHGNAKGLAWPNALLLPPRYEMRPESNTCTKFYGARACVLSAIRDALSFALQAASSAGANEVDLASAEDGVAVLSQFAHGIRGLRCALLPSHLPTLHSLCYVVFIVLHIVYLRDM
jgi:hypothetical protein